MAFSRKVDRSLKTCHSEASAPRNPWYDDHPALGTGRKAFVSGIPRLGRLGMTGPLKKLLFLENAIFDPAPLESPARSGIIRS
jgi:hypothetical protein